jgi:hypothetical protein
MSIRSARPTIRCLTEDLGIDLPSLDESLDDLDHQWLEELHRVADASPQGQKRIESIDHPLVFRLRVSDHRGATWVDEDRNVVWLCAVHKREDGSDDDAYEWFKGLHADGNLLPTEEDLDRLLVDAAIEVFRTAEDDLLQLVDEGIAEPREELAKDLGDWLPCRVVVTESEGIQEIWCAISVRDRHGAFVSEQIKNGLFLSLEAHLDPVLMEARHDWPEGQAEWFEVVRLGIR